MSATNEGGGAYDYEAYDELRERNSRSVRLVTREPATATRVRCGVVNSLADRLRIERSCLEICVCGRVRACVLKMNDDRIGLHLDHSTTTTTTTATTITYRKNVVKSSARCRKEENRMQMAELALCANRMRSSRRHRRRRRRR